tara:strand:- start:9313 stop:9894 length:582 start_codon:yes stop_codon:yes gene_type:complete
MNNFNEKNFIKNYLRDLHKILNQEKNYNKKLRVLKKNILNLNEKNKKVMFVGNGGSASTSSHASVDLTKNAKIKSINFNEANLITCFSNDYGGNNWIKEAINYYGDHGDMLIIFSCSGNSKNLVNAAKFALKNKIQVVTFTGKTKNNSIKKINKKGLNFFVPSKSYNQIEIIHHLLILLLVDLCIGKKIYPVS